MRASELHRLARQLREIALIATGNTGEEQVSMGELLVVEDLASHPGSAIREITERTGLAQSLVSRVTASMREHGIFHIKTDPNDTRKTLVSISPAALALFRERGTNSINQAVSSALPFLDDTAVERFHDLLSELNNLIIKGRESHDKR